MVKDCQEYDSGCKIFHHEPYYTPNNYDVFFDYNSIPVNIPVEKPHDFRNRLQKLMPLTKIVHLNMDSETFKEDNNIHLHTKLKLNYKTLEQSSETQLKLTTIWDDNQDNPTSTLTYKLHSLYNDESLITNARIRLVNLHYPLQHYDATSDTNGEYVFSNIPYGSYAQQIFIPGFNIPVEIMEINEEEIIHEIHIGSTEEYSESDGSVQLNFYQNGILIVSSWVYDNGEVVSSSDDRFQDGELTIDVEESSIEDSTHVLMNSSGFENVNIYSEFTVDIIGANNEVVDSVPLNFKNNYTKLSKRLPLYDNGEEIEYSLSYSMDNCNVESEYHDIIKYNTNEVVLL